MKIAHIVQVTPHRSGLYETARELAEGLRDIGHAACMVDPELVVAVGIEAGTDGIIVTGKM